MLTERRLCDRKNYAVGSYLEDRHKYKYLLVLRQVYEKIGKIAIHWVRLWRGIGGLGKVEQDEGKCVC